MNASSERNDATSPPPARLRAAVARSAPHTARAFVLAVVCGFAHAQEVGLAAMVAADARPCLRHADPEVRGEAALIVAVHAAHADHAELLALASDPEPAARHRAIVALALLGTPAAVQFLGRVLDDTGTRGEADGVAAAFGLGIVGPGAGTADGTRFLSSIAKSSWKRQRDALLGYLLAMTRHLDRTETVALRQLLDDESNRDPEVRALLLHLLLPHDRTFDERFLKKQLVRASDPERIELLNWLARDHVALDADWLATLERLAGQADTGDVRAAALAALTRARHLPALDLAARALRDGTAAECAQAVRSLLVIGGAPMLRAVAPRIRDERDAGRKAAMLGAYDAPLPDDLADQCRRITTDGGQPWSLRGAAALTLARNAGPQAATILRDMFRGTTDGPALPALAAALRATHDEPAPLDRLVDGGDLAADPERWVALLRAEHPEAQRQVLAGLREPLARGARPLPALRAWRRATVLAAPPSRAAALPALLGDLLGR